MAKHFYKGLDGKFTKQECIDLGLEIAVRQKRQLSCKEIALFCDCTEQMIHRILKSGLKKVREKLGREWLTFLILLLPLCSFAQSTNGLAWCFVHDTPVTMVTNKVVRDTGVAILGGIERTQTINLQCPICKVKQTVTRTTIMVFPIAHTNLFQNRRVMPVIKKK